jgi:hypothetical protein
MSARTIVIARLNEIVATTPALAELGVVVVEAARNLGELDRPKIVLKTGQYSPTPQAPTRNVTWTGTATLISPHRDQEESEQQLEDLLEAIAPKLLTAALRWTGADLTAYSDQLNALDITLEAIFQKE